MSQGKHSPDDVEMFGFMFSAARNLHCDNVQVKVRVCYLSQHRTHTNEMYYTQFFTLHCYLRFSQPCLNRTVS